MKTKLDTRIVILGRYEYDTSWDSWGFLSCQGTYGFEYCHEEYSPMYYNQTLPWVIACAVWVNMYFRCLLLLLRR